MAARTRTSGRRDAILSSAGGLPPDGPRCGLIAACLRGNRDTWEELVQSHAGPVYTVLRRCGLGEDEAADLFQEVWVAAWDGLAQVQDERALKGWLVTIAARTGTRALRRRIGGPVGGEAYDDAAPHAPDAAPSREQAALVRERDEGVRAAIASLSERDRQLVYAFFYDPATPSYAEIAARLGVSSATVGPLRTRCLLRLHRALGDRLGRTGTEA